MYSYSTDQIVKQTAETLNLPLSTVQKVIKHSFDTLYKELLYPTYPAYMLEDLCSWTITPQRMAVTFSRSLEVYRKYPDPNKLKKLQHLAKVRYLASSYRQTRKFKERFGSWYWK